MTPKIFGRLLRETMRKWWADDVPHLGAALAFYAALAIAPLMILAMAGLGLVLGRDVARNELLAQMHGLIGPQGTKALETVIRSAEDAPEALLATGAGLITLALAVTGVFVELQDALNRIWKARGPGTVTLKKILKGRLFSFGIILVIGFLLLISLVISAILAAAGKYMSTTVPGYPLILQTVSTITSFFLITVLFALIFKILPDTKVAWSNVWVGASLTSALFTVGKVLIGLYLGRSVVTSTYGAAGSLVVLLLWVYFSSQILFFGAEFTYVYSRHHLLPPGSGPDTAGGVPVAPSESAPDVEPAAVGAAAVATAETALTPAEQGKHRVGVTQMVRNWLHTRRRSAVKTPGAEPEA